MTADSTTSRPLPLHGATVLELGTMITAPYAGMMLAELGATVIKVENPNGGDPFRATGGGSYGPNFVAYNHSKQGLTLDLKGESGRAAFEALLRRSDVLLENYRPGIMDKLGYSAEAVRSINPRIVHCSITGFGADGPYATRPAYDAVASALSGIYSLAVDPQNPRLVGVTISDNVTGMYAVNGIVSALYDRERTGLGRRIEVNMLESAIAFSPDAFAYHTQNNVLYGPSSRVASSQCFAFTCADGKLLAVHLSLQVKFWENFLRAVGDQPIAHDPRFKERAGRVSNYDALNSEIATIITTQSRSYWMEQLQRCDVPFAPINTIPEVLEDAQVRHLDTFCETQHPSQGRVVTIRSPVHFDGAVRTNTSPPMLGEHNAEILASLGLPADAAPTSGRPRAKETSE
jgi:crotonobetainyl-CoA:carnitine CoA-transferase CaiB-like acyl-CoA transferase